MRKLVLIAICCTGVFCAPLPLIAQKGGGQTPLIPVADMPNAGGGATAPAEPPLEVDAEEVPELIPPQSVGGGAQAPAPEPTPAPEPSPAPAPEPEPVEPNSEPTASVAVPQRTTDAAPAQADDGEEPVGEVPDDAPTAPEPDEDEEEQQGEEEFEEEFDDVPEPGEPDAPVVTPQAEAGPQLPRTGADLPALLLSGMALTASGMSLRALCRGRS